MIQILPCMLGLLGRRGLLNRDGSFHVVAAVDDGRQAMTVIVSLDPEEATNPAPVNRGPLLD
jgi:hypothetical protein